MFSDLYFKALFLSFTDPIINVVIRLGEILDKLCLANNSTQD